MSSSISYFINFPSNGEVHTYTSGQHVNPVGIAITFLTLLTIYSLLLSSTARFITYSLVKL